MLQTELCTPSEKKRHVGSHRKMEAEIRVMSLQAKEPQGLPASHQKPGQTPGTYSLIAPGGPGLTDTLSSDFCPRTVRQSISTVQAPGLYSVTAALANPPRGQDPRRGWEAGPWAAQLWGSFTNYGVGCQLGTPVPEPPSMPGTVADSSVSHSERQTHTCYLILTRI